MTEFIRINFLVETYEFFNREFYDSCVEQGSCSSMKEYLDYVASELYCDSSISIKLTPSLLNVTDWDPDLVSKCGIHEAIRAHKSKVLLLRLDPLAGPLSTANALATGEWHFANDQPSANPGSLHEYSQTSLDSQCELLYSCLVDYLQAEMQLLNLSLDLGVKKYILYEHLLASPIVFGSQLQFWAQQDCGLTVADARPISLPPIRPTPKRAKVFDQSSLKILSESQFAVIEELVGKRQVVTEECLSRLQLLPLSMSFFKEL